MVSILFIVQDGCGTDTEPKSHWHCDCDVSKNCGNFDISKNVYWRFNWLLSVKSYTRRHTNQKT